MSFIVAEKSTVHGLLLIITDKELVGKKFEEGKRQLDLSNNFYRGEEKNKEQVKDLIKRAYILHLTGKKILGVVQELGLIDLKTILTVKNVPHLEIIIDQNLS